MSVFKILFIIHCLCSIYVLSVIRNRGCEVDLLQVIWIVFTAPYTMLIAGVMTVIDSMKGEKE